MGFAPFPPFVHASFKSVQIAPPPDSHLQPGVEPPARRLGPVLWQGPVAPRGHAAQPPEHGAGDGRTQRVPLGGPLRGAAPDPPRAVALGRRERGRVGRGRLLGAELAAACLGPRGRRGSDNHGGAQHVSATRASQARPGDRPQHVGGRCELPGLSRYSAERVREAAAQSGSTHPSGCNWVANTRVMISWYHGSGALRCQPSSLDP